MKTLLHILTRPEDALVTSIVEEQSAIEETAVEVADLTRADADYARLVERIFAADSIQVW